MTTVTIGVLRVKDAYRMSIEFSWTNTFAFLATSTNGGEILHLNLHEKGIPNDPLK